MADRVTDRYRAVLDGSLRAVLRVEFTRERREIVDYSVVLLVDHEEELKVVRLYDGAHGFNEQHRHTLTRGKQPAERFHPGTLGEGMRDAIRQVRASYEAMIDSWREG